MGRTITVAGQQLHGIKHICCFYESEEELRSVFVPYLREGLECGEHVVCIFPHGHHARLRDDLGAPKAEGAPRGRLDLMTDDVTYTADGIFAKERMVELLRSVLTEARDGDAQHVRTLGEMRWALHNVPGTEDLVEYESVVNDLCTEFDCTLACAYDITAFSGRVLADALSTHSHIVLNGAVHENPHFIPPAQFKHFMAKRRAPPAPVRAERSR